MKILRITISALLLCSSCFVFRGEQQRAKTDYADKLHKEYRFAEAIKAYRELLKNEKDSAAIVCLQNRIIQCENGLSLMEYVVRPKPVAQKTVKVKDFYLHIPDLPDRSWIPIPNPLIKKGEHKYYSAVHFPENQNRILFSAPDESDSWNIYMSERISGNHWSAPIILSEVLTSAGDEIFPHLSKDGKTLFFASDGLAGMGGFDLFMSTWDEEAQEWTVPVNLGFPFSSTGNDIFYMNSNDGRNSIFVSDRDCSGDDTRIYVTRYIATPVKTALEEEESAVELASLKVVTEEREPEVKPETASAPSNMKEYSALVYRMRNLRQSYRNNLQKLEENRTVYARSGREEQKKLAEIISGLESRSYEIKKKLDAASADVQKAEMDFLAKGIIPVIIEKETEDETEISSAPQHYEFTRNTLGKIPYMEVEIPKPKFDYSFRILKEAQFAEDNSLPDGIVYQIQIAVLGKTASIKWLKGLSPVFVKKLPSGKYLHTVGLFYSHAEALSNLNKVRKRGFSQAFIVAYKNGRSISVKEARRTEKVVNANAQSYQIVLRNYPDGLPSAVITTIKGASEKEISRAFVDNETLYMVGPFKQKSDAEYLFKILKDLGIANVSLETIKL